MKNQTSIFSQDRVYRYSLWHQFAGSSSGQPSIIPEQDRPLRICMFIGLNPSTADEVVDDNTLRRCIDFSKRWGYTALCMANLFALRATDPKVMMKHPDPVGAGNVKILLDIAKDAGAVVAAWGNDGGHLGQDAEVKRVLAANKIPLFHLGLTQKGFPFHPLYRRSKTLPINWTNYEA